MGYKKVVSHSHHSMGVQFSQTFQHGFNIIPGRHPRSRSPGEDQKIQWTSGLHQSAPMHWPNASVGSLRLSADSRPRYTELLLLLKYGCRGSNLTHLNIIQYYFFPPRFLMEPYGTLEVIPPQPPFFLFRNLQQGVAYKKGVFFHVEINRWIDDRIDG